MNKRVTRDFEGSRLESPVTHRAEHALQIDRLGCRPRGGFDDSGEDIFNRSHKAAGTTHCIAEMTDNPCGRGLPVGSGDASNGKGSGGISVKSRRDAGHGLPGLRDTHDRNGDACQFLLGHDGNGSALDRLQGVAASVILASGKGKKEIPFLHNTRVTGQSGDLGLSLGGDRKDRKTAQEPLQPEGSLLGLGLEGHGRSQWTAAVAPPVVPDWAVTRTSSAGRSR